MSGRLALVLALVLSASSASAAKPGGFERSWKKAQKHYQAGRFEAVLPVLDKLKQTELTADQRRLVLEREAFVLFFLGLHTQAREAWLKLLEAWPDASPDPDRDSPELVSFFGRIRQEKESAARQPPAPPEAPVQAPGSDTAPAEAPAPPLAAPEPPPAASPPAGAPATSAPAGSAPEVTQLTAAQLDVPVVTDTLPAEAVAPRGCGVALCLLPFGVGQFANGRPGKGALFLGLGAALLATNVAMYQSRISELERRGHFADPPAARMKLQVQRGALLGAGAVAVLGVVDAFAWP